jgi:ABC-type multidrug transport system fused ATPase/permease subunit
MPERKMDTRTYETDSSSGIIDIGGGKRQVVSGMPIRMLHGYKIPLPDNIRQKILSEDRTKAFERIDTAARMNLEQLEQNIAQARKESSQFFKLTLIFSSLGFLVVLAAVGLLLGGQTVAGIVSAVASAIPEVTAALFFKKDKELRGSIEKYHHHLIESQRILTMIDVAETVHNKEERDSIKREIICKAIGIDVNAVSSKTPPESLAAG